MLLSFHPTTAGTFYSFIWNVCRFLNCLFYNSLVSTLQMSSFLIQHTTFITLLHFISGMDEQFSCNISKQANTFTLATIYTLSLLLCGACVCSTTAMRGFWAIPQRNAAYRLPNNHRHSFTAFTLLSFTLLQPTCLSQLNPVVH